MCPPPEGISFMLSSLCMVDGDIAMCVVGIVESGPILWEVVSLLLIIVSSDQLQMFLNELFKGCMRERIESRVVGHGYIQQDRGGSTCSAGVFHLMRDKGQCRESIPN